MAVSKLSLAGFVIAILAVVGVGVLYYVVFGVKKSQGPTGPAGTFKNVSDLTISGNLFVDGTATIGKQVTAGTVITSQVHAPTGELDHIRGQDQGDGRNGGEHGQEARGL